MKSTSKWLCAILACTALVARPTYAQSSGDRKVAEAGMIKADEAFNRAASDHDDVRFRALIADDATFGGASPNQTRGVDAIVQSWAPFLHAGGPTLTWKPTRAEVLAGGEVGYTVGTWERRSLTPDGKAIAAHGQYMTVWAKQKDGSWKAIFDTGGEDPHKP